MTRTNAYTLLCMVIRAVAVFTAASFVISLPRFVVGLRNQALADGTMTFVVIAMLAVVLIVGVLWLFADKIARLALVRPQDQVFESSLEPVAWLGIAISSIGAWNLFAGLTDALYLLTKWQVLSRFEEQGMGDAGLAELVPDGVATIAQILLALVFLLRGPGLSRLFHRLRYGEATHGDPAA
jgi:hypothetical protein